MCFPASGAPARRCRQPAARHTAYATRPSPSPDLLQNALGHVLSGHSYGLAPVCTLPCLASELLSENCPPQPGQLHVWGLSPVWVRMWTVKAEAWMNRLPQPSQSHTHRRSLVWIRS